MSFQNNVLVTTTALGASKTFTSDWLDLSEADAKQLIALATADQTGTLYVDFSEDKTNISVSVKAACDASPTSPLQVGAYGNEADIETNPFSRYYRTRFVNGATAQTEFALSVRLVTS